VAPLLRAVLFDFDGTLVDSEELHRQAYNLTFLKFHLGWSWNAAQYEQLLGISGGSDRIVAYINGLKQARAESDRLRRLVPGMYRAKTKLYGELLADGTHRLRPGVLRLFGEAREHGIKIGIAATSALRNVHPLLATAFAGAPGQAIGSVVGAEMVERKKPAADIYRLLLSTLRVSAADCVAFEDSTNGLAAARSAGLCTIVTPSRWTGRQDFAGADLLLDKLGDRDDPLDDRDAARIGGARCLGLAQITDLHVKAERGRSNPELGKTADARPEDDRRESG
jgi:beta-phosphoglucomutase-like phosphatase (HAD superfamily)